MRTCFVIPSFDFFLSHRYQLIKRLAYKYEIFVLTDISDVEKKMIAKLKNENIQLINIPMRKKSGLRYFIYYFLELKKSLKEIQAEKVFLVTLELTFFGSILCQLDPYIKKWHFLITGMGPFYEANNIRYKIFKKLFKLNIKFFLNHKKCLFIFQNPDDCDYFKLQSLISNNNYEIIQGNGIDCYDDNFYHSIDDSSLNPRFCFVGRLAKSKGIIEFIDASKVIYKTYPLVKFLIAGSFKADAPDYCSREFYSDLINLPNVVFVGHIEHKQVKGLYKPGDIFVLPSSGEGLPKAALEAAANSLPLILTDVPGCRECIEKNGIFIQKGDVSQLTKAMEAFICEPGLIKIMGMESVKLCKKRFDIKKIVYRFDKLIQRQSI